MPLESFHDSYHDSLLSPLKGYEGQGCVNINECINGDHLCVEHSTCFDNDGSYTCECDYGYEGYGRTKCDNVNECSRRVGECSKFALCIDKKGSYDCKCLDGYEDKSGGTGKVCEDIDECTAGTHDCATVRPGSTCINKEPGFECGCNNGYEESPTGCIDIDECEVDAKNQCTATLCNNCLNQVFKTFD